ncbi:SDR family NAD(P)-dependent oxidoreductase [Crossiella sp. NPDC003009]
MTGASRGIGAETARLLARRGARVVVNYRDKATCAAQVVDEITGLGGEAIGVPADLTEPDAVRAMAGQVQAAYGRLGLLVLNASGGMECGVDPAAARPR